MDVRTPIQWAQSNDPVPEGTRMSDQAYQFMAILAYFIVMICQLCQIKVLILFVMPVNKARVISYRFQSRVV